MEEQHLEIVTGVGQVAVCLLVPALTLWLEKRSKIVQTLSPVVICYLVGIGFGNQPWFSFSEDLALGLCSVTVALAIPLLLFSVDLVAWFKLARNTVVSFAIAVVSVMSLSAATHFVLHGRLTESHKIAGMLVGVFVGGTPNMAAIGTALGVKNETFILLNASDVIACTAYILLLLTVGIRLLGKILPPTPRIEAGDQDEAKGEEEGRPPVRDLALGLGLAAAVVALGAGVRLLMPESLQDSVSILAITTLAVAASFVKRIRALPGTHDTGQFLLLIFCVSIGFTADFAELLEAPTWILLFTAIVVFGSVALHVIFCAIFRIDRDTMIITSIAGFFGPHMVGPVAVTLKNRDIVFSGIASGLVGYALGNYLGVGLSYLLAYLTG